MHGDYYPAQLIQFMQTELAVPEAAVAVALNHWQGGIDPLPMIFWQYGLVSLDQLERIFDWLGEQAVIASAALFDPV